MPTDDDYRRARKVALYYRSLGLCPLPSRMEGRKSPMLASYTEHYDGVQVPESVYDAWSTTNIQLICGVRSPTPLKILVVDLDGHEALDAWAKICQHHQYVPFQGWQAVTGGGGRHVYYRLPEGTPACPAGIIWGLYDTFGNDGRGTWAKHKEIRIQGDGCLVIAPPSIHIDTGRPYEFLEPTPRVYRLPEIAPDWLLAMPRLGKPRFTADEPKEKPAVWTVNPGSWTGYTRDEVLQAVGGHKLAVAKEWGLKVATNIPNASGWVTCYVPGREEEGRSRPSGSFHFSDGTLQDRKDGTTISFFDLGVVLGRFADWRDCRTYLGQRFVGTPSRSRKKIETNYQFQF